MSLSRDRPEVQRRNPVAPTDYKQEHLRADAFNLLSVAIAQLTLGGNLLTVNDQLCDVLGRPRKDLLEKNFREIFEPEDSSSVRESGLTRLIRGEIHHYSTNSRVQRTDGQVVWFKMFFSLVREDVTEMPRSLVAIAIDVTLLQQDLQEAASARDELSHRMTNAQEADRTRIARELHDDIGQSLAVLKIQMLRAGRPVSGLPNQVHPSVRDLIDTLDMITNKVRRLSHDLHSSELEFLGLAVAVQAQCRECSEHLHVPVHCSCNQVQQKLDGTIALAFLRVLQEALHNVIKHSRAKNITVRLTGSESELILEVCDDGAGFDIESSKLAAGLGLISMRERVHLISGEFEIQSSVGHGTRITARAPVSSQS
jgi:PAS domain S-box-containing protein